MPAATTSNPESEPQRPNQNTGTHVRSWAQLAQHCTYLWPVICLFQLGLILGLVSVWLRASSGTKAVEPPMEDSREIGSLDNVVWERKHDGDRAQYQSRDDSLLAQLSIARRHLEEDDAEQALGPLRQAVASANGSAIQPAAVLTLAAAYLMTDNPRAAHAVLLDNREQVMQEAYRPTAAFLDSLARHRGDFKINPPEAGELLAALLAVGDEPVLGPAGQLLMGQAFRELGMTQQMADLYESALKNTHGPLAVKMAYSLADYFCAAEHVERARQLFLALAEAHSPRWAPRARLRLAEMAYDAKQPAESLQWCRRVLQEPGDLLTPAVLLLMGRAFEQAGDDRRAARCFAGLLPEASR